MNQIVKISSQSCSLAIPRLELKLYYVFIHITSVSFSENIIMKLTTICSSTRKLKEEIKILRELRYRKAHINSHLEAIHPTFILNTCIKKL